jgi:hypothetical protein
MDEEFDTTEEELTSHFPQQKDLAKLAVRAVSEFP